MGWVGQQFQTKSNSEFVSGTNCNNSSVTKISNKFQANLPIKDHLT